MQVRPFQPDDAAACAQVYFRAVRDGAVRYYSDAQRRAWAPETPDSTALGEKLLNAETFVAVRDGEVVGFMSMTRAGHIDLAFVLPDEMGRGTADALYAALLNRAVSLGIAELTVDASHLARSFFLRHGWIAGPAETIIRNEVSLSRTFMSLNLRK
ncbi:GNAT family N-acetyltransferase [Shimia ponticola]|uniref:GNAT family N-acetyltransferase n=1 Tax=Shimia ponticola TaxID=2582893 RepID=UPI0011BFD00B|nr:GNAT family N-acetyltransferase [Shimia ponticola]